MQTRRLVIVSGVSGIIGGLLRILSAFIPWRPDDAALEIFYLGTDLTLLFGLMGIYLVRHRDLSIIALAGFGIAVSGFALITGPDGQPFGIDIYSTGVIIIMIGLTLLSVDLLRTRTGAHLAAATWLLSFVIGAAGPPFGYDAESFMIAGILFGAGFVLAGIDLIRPARSD